MSGKRWFGLALVVLLLIGVASYTALSAVTRDYDPGFYDMYVSFVKKLLDTGDPADAMVWAVPVEEGISVQEVKEALKSLAVDHGILFVGDSDFYKQVEAVTGEPFRHVSFMSFCDARVGKKMAEYNNAYTALMPCRISVVEDEAGRVWLYSMNLDFLIYGGKKLPTDLKKDALRVRDTLRGMMQSAAKGDF